MALTVETGTGSSASDAYVSVAAWKAWAAARGYSYDAFETADIEGAIRRGTEGIDRLYRARFPGVRTNGRVQALEWPRAGVVDAKGYGVDSDEVPAEIVSASNEAAWRELNTPGSLQPDVAAGGGIIKRVKADTVEVEYAANGRTAPSFDAIEAALSGLLAASSEYSAMAERV